MQAGKKKKQEKPKRNPKPEQKMRSRTASPSARRKGASLRSRALHALAPGSRDAGREGCFPKNIKEGHPDEQDEHHSENGEPRQ
jgi:hypothetical protein